MKIKVRFFDWALLKDYFSLISVIGVIFTFCSIFITIPVGHKWIVALALVLFFALIYVILWIRANLLDETIIKINNSTVEVKVGDIFKEKGLKVIAFNEYFDTLVNNVVISETTLNGMYIKNVLNDDVCELDQLIEESDHLSEAIIEENKNRRQGKKNRYKLGTIFKHNDYLLTAFSQFDEQNRAFLSLNGYVNCLLNFWNEVDIVYNGRSVSIPLLGSGITRFKEYSFTDQELLELLVWSFKTSRIKFTYPSKVSIIIHDSRVDKINFYKLNELA